MHRTQDVIEEILLDHILFPKNYMRLHDTESCTAVGHNTTCGDEIEVYIEMESSYIKDISFFGQCCATVNSSASLMTVETKGRTISEVKTIFDKVRQATSLDYDSDDLLQQLINNLTKKTIEKKHDDLITCVLLPWSTMFSTLDNDHLIRCQPKRDYSCFLE